MCHAPLYPVFVPHVICDIFLLFTHQLKMPPQEGWDAPITLAVLSEARGRVGFPICICWFRFPGFCCYLFQWKVSFQNASLSSHELPQVSKRLGFVWLRFVLFYSLTWSRSKTQGRISLWVCLGSKANPLHKQKHSNKCCECDRLVSVSQSPAVPAFPEASLYQWGGGGQNSCLDHKWILIFK